MRFKISDISKLPKHIQEQIVITNPRKKSKYNSKIVEYDGYKFHSVKECNRYKELQLLVKYNHITELKLQVPFELIVNGNIVEKYIADFTYIDDKGNYIVEDCKGFRTSDYKRKNKWMKSVHGITIFES